MPKNEKTACPYLISVIIPFYKEIDLIGDAVASVLMQIKSIDFQVEIVIGNDGSYSSDQILDTLPLEAKGSTIIVKNDLDHGAGNARNCALSIAKGRYFAFLDADDIWLDSKLAIQLKLAYDTGATFIASGYSFIGSENTVRPPRSIISTIDFLKNSTVGTSTILIARELLSDDRFLNLQSSQDTELWARLAGKNHFRYAFSDDILVTYRPSSRTSNKARQFLGFRRVVCLFNITLSDKLIIYIRYMIRGVFNHVVKKFI